MSLMNRFSPACILSFLFTGLRRGELKQVWQWKDEPEEKKSEDQDLKVLEPVKPEHAGDNPRTQGDAPIIDGSTTELEPVTEGGTHDEVGDDEPQKRRRSKEKHA